MSKIQLSYTTKLEAISDRDDVQAILNAKLESTSPSSVVDYIGLADSHIQTKIEDIAIAIKKLQELKKHEASRLEHIKEQCAVWLGDTGLDKLEGLIISSITVNETKPKETLIIEEAALIKTKFWKSKIDESAVKKALQDGEEVKGARLEVTYVADKIRINKKK